jgi:hypothetical protein
LAFVSGSDRLTFTFPIGVNAGNQFFTGRNERTHAREFDFHHLPHVRLTDEDDENENWQYDVEYVGEQGTFKTGIRHKSNNFGCPRNTHQQEETQDHFKSAIKSDTFINDLVGNRKCNS